MNIKAAFIARVMRQLWASVTALSSFSAAV